MSWFDDEKLRTDVEELIRDGMSYSDIEKLTGIANGSISYYAIHKMGTRKLTRLTEKSVKEVNQPAQFSYSVLEDEIKEAENHLKQLRELREKLKVKYWIEESSLFLEGLGRNTISVDPRRVLQWIINGGAAELRTWLIQQLKTEKVAS